MEVLVTHRNGNEYRVLIDDADMKLFDRGRFYVSATIRNPYVSYYDSKRNGGVGGRCQAIGRIITAAPKGMDVDHINGDVLDNRRQNLRIVTRAQNQLNQYHKRTTHGKPTSKYVGVLWNSRDRAWTGYVQYKGRRFVKNFKTEQAAYLWRKNIRDSFLGVGNATQTTQD